MSGNEEIYTSGKNFTLPPVVTALTNSTSAVPLKYFLQLPTKCHSKVFGFVKSSEFALNPATQLWWLWDLYLYPATLPI